MPDEFDYAAWLAYMRSRAGRFTIDIIHNGVDRDLIAFIPDADDPSQGDYLTASGNTMWTGRYEDAVPHIGDAVFFWQFGLSLVPAPEHTGRRASNGGMAAPSGQLADFIGRLLGAPFLMVEC